MTPLAVNMSQDGFLRIIISKWKGRAAFPANDSIR